LKNLGGGTAQFPKKLRKVHGAERKGAKTVVFLCRTIIIQKGNGKKRGPNQGERGHRGKMSDYKDRLSKA